MCLPAAACLSKSQHIILLRGEEKQFLKQKQQKKMFCCEPESALSVTFWTLTAWCSSNFLQPVIKNKEAIPRETMDFYNSWFWMLLLCRVDKCSEMLLLDHIIGPLSLGDSNLHLKMISFHIQCFPVFISLSVWVSSIELSLYILMESKTGYFTSLIWTLSQPSLPASKIRNNIEINITHPELNMASFSFNYLRNQDKSCWVFCQCKYCYGFTVLLKSRPSTLKASKQANIQSWILEKMNATVVLVVAP